MLFVFSFKKVNFSFPINSIFRVVMVTVVIFLGVIRSGKLSDKKGYTVDVYTSAEDTAAAVSAFGGEAMPEGLY